MNAGTVARPARSGPGVQSRSPSRTWRCGSTSQTVPQVRPSRQCGHRTNGPCGNAGRPRGPGGAPAWRIWCLQMPGLDLSALQGIDVHVHVESDGHGGLSLDDELLAASARYFKASNDRAPTVEQIAAYYRELRFAAVVFTVDATTATGHPALPSEEMAERAGEEAVRRARRLITDHGVRGFKFHPSLQAFSPDDRSYYPLYSVIEEAGLPAVFHTGQTGIGAGLPGGRGIKLRLSNPMLLDDVAADFPGMPIIMAHPSVPWQDSAISIATHKANVYIDLSGWSPKYFPPQLVRNMNSLLQDKVLFGTDYPLLTPERWLRDFDQLDLKPGVRPKVLKENAIRMLGLGA